jgi:ATP-binding cassette, subfamily C, bacterial CydC
MRAIITILTVSRRQWLWMLAGIALGVIVIAANSMLMALAGWFIATMAVAGATGVQAGYFMPSVGIRILAILRTTGRYGERLVTHDAAFRQLADLRAWMFRKLAPLAPAGLEKYAGGDIAGRLRADIDSLENIYLRILAPLAIGSISILLAVAWTASWSISSAMVLLFFLLIPGLALPLLANRLAVGPGKQSAALSAELRNSITEGLQGVEELTILGAQKKQAEQVDSLSASLITEQKRLGEINALTQSGGFAASGLAAAALLVTGSMSVATGTLTGPEMVMVLLFAGAAFEAPMALPNAMQLIPATSHAASRILAVTESLLPVPDPSTGAELPKATDIIFKNVDCSYVTGIPVISNFNAEISSGSRIALVGPSGSGKSTLAELLLRFRDYRGSITIGGTELRTLTADDLLTLISAVPQQPHLFNTTIRENILIGYAEATADQLQQAVEDAGLAAWIKSLPLGMETPVGEGGSAVSGGEERRIALARALLKDAPILILDEPTEGLDAKTEQRVIEGLRKRTTGKTMILITHRPACMELAERVMILSRG